MGVKNLAVLSVPLVAAGILGSSVAANAADIVGTLEISASNLQAVATGLQDPQGNFTTTLDFGFIGDDEAGDPDTIPGIGEFAINSASGVLAEFNPPPFQAGRIKDLPEGGQFFPVDDFLSFASNVGGTQPVTNPAQFNTTFDLLELEDVTYTATANGINAIFDVNGIFTLGDGTTYEGEGLIGGEILFSAQPGQFDDLESFLDYISVAGNVVNVDSVSGNFDLIQPPAPVVPEPATIFGLIATLGLGASLKKAQRKDS